MAKLEELKARRVKNFKFIPSYLLEQAKGFNWDMDLLQAIDDFGIDHFIYALVKPGVGVKGVVWFTVDFLARAIFLALVSLDREYQGDTKGIWNITKELIEPVAKKLGMKKIYSLTTRERGLRSLGFERKSILMEYNLED